MGNSEPCDSEIMACRKLGIAPHVICANCGAVIYCVDKMVLCPNCRAKPFISGLLPTCPCCGGTRTNLIRGNYWLCHDCDIVFDISIIDF
jgi:hypothetical protein